jgi:hypothetical protein
VYIDPRRRQCRLGVRQCYLTVLLRIFGNGCCYRIIEAMIEDVKFAGRDRRSRLSRQLGNGLANITVIANDLFNRKPLLKQVAPVQRRRWYNVGIQSTIGRAPQGRDELIQKDRYPMCSLRRRKLRLRPARHHSPTAIKQECAIRL